MNERHAGKGTMQGRGGGKTHQGVGLPCGLHGHRAGVDETAVFPELEDGGQGRVALVQAALVHAVDRLDELALLVGRQARLARRRRSGGARVRCRPGPWGHTLLLLRGGRGQRLALLGREGRRHRQGAAAGTWQLGRLELLRRNTNADARVQRRRRRLAVHRVGTRRALREGKKRRKRE